MFLPLILSLAAQSAPAPSTPVAGAPPPDVRSAIQDCAAHKFETVVTAMVEGQPKSSKLRLCGTAGQTDVQWIATLKDSVNKLTLNFQMQGAMREAMVAALNGEIARLQGGTAAAANVAPITIKPREAAKDTGLAGYNSLPPMPAPTPAASVDLARAPKLPPPVARPPIRMECFSPGGAGEAPCTEFERSTMLVVAARGVVQPGVKLRFLRDGEQRAEVALGPMRKGQTRRILLPAQVCHGVTSAQLKVDTMVTPPVKDAAPQRTSSEGPFYLRCF